jgi:AcrR family transcriptional regulator
MNLASTRGRLLDHAERLFARKGIATTSIRDIVTAARANLGAVTYHFGSKDALVRAVIERRLRPLDEERRRLLDAAEAAGRGRPPALEAILHAAIAPTIRLRREHPGFMRIVGRMLSDPDAALQKSAEAEALMRRFLEAIARALPGVPRDELAWRMCFLRGALVHTWTGGGRPFRGAARRDDGDEALVRRLIGFGAAGLRAPLAGERAGRLSEGRGGGRSSRRRRAGR